MRLINETKKQTLVTQVTLAKSWLDRMRGLLGRMTMSDNEALWIKHCPSIHTFFMKFAIDVIFVDRNLKVSALYLQVRPWRVICSKDCTTAVFETKAGVLTANNISVGDQLNVVS